MTNSDEAIEESDPSSEERSSVLKTRGREDKQHPSKKHRYHRGIKPSTSDPEIPVSSPYNILIIVSWGDPSRHDMYTLYNYILIYEISGCLNLDGIYYFDRYIYIDQSNKESLIIKCLP